MNRTCVLPAQRGQDLFGMPGGFDLGPDTSNNTVLVEQERHASNALNDLAVQRLLAPNAAGCREAVPDVCQ